MDSRIGTNRAVESEVEDEFGGWIRGRGRIQRLNGMILAKVQRLLDADDVQGTAHEIFCVVPPYLY